MSGVDSTFEHVYFRSDLETEGGPKNRDLPYMLTTFPGRARLTCPSWKHGVNESAKSTAKPAPYFFCTHDKAPEYSPHIGTARID